MGLSRAARWRLAGAWVTVIWAGSASAADLARVLFLSKSSGYEHSSIARRGEEPSHVEKALAELGRKHGFELVATKDASLIRAAELVKYDAVLFYTTGDLTQSGDGKGLFAGDGETAMGPDGVVDLIRWVEGGGALLGFHPASDTFHGADGEPSPYIELLGGEFLTHGQQFPGKLRIVDVDHAAMARIPQYWTIVDEWYAFKNMAVDRIHVLALLDTSSDPYEQEVYRRDPYPVIWCSARGAGRVFYSAMGHREDVWDNPIFQSGFIDALNWALGRAPLDAEPNYRSAVPNFSESSR